MKCSLRVCKNGHRYYKSSDCLTCPVCEQGRKPDNGFLSLISAPVRRALEGAGIKTLISSPGIVKGLKLRKNNGNWVGYEITVNGRRNTFIPKL